MITKTPNNFLALREPNAAHIHLYMLSEITDEGAAEITIAPFIGKALHFAVEGRKVCTRDSVEVDMSLSGETDAFTSTMQIDHVNMLNQAISILQNDDMQKVVLSRKRVVEGSFVPEDLFLKLEALYPSACVFLLSTDQTGCWMGATPERLLLVENGKATAASLAGTRPSGTKESWGEKETEEQRIVTEEIKHVFGDSGLTGVHESILQTKTAGKIEHLFTEVSGQMPDGLSPSALAAKLHPTPAVGGLPQKEAVDYILKNEAFSREFYTGYFGIQSPENSRFYVNLRSMQLFKNGLVLYAGGGITSASNPEAEWEETERKLRTLLDVIED